MRAALIGDVHLEKCQWCRMRIRKKVKAEHFEALGGELHGGGPSDPSA